MILTTLERYTLSARNPLLSQVRFISSERRQEL